MVIYVEFSLITSLFNNENGNPLGANHTIDDRSAQATMIPPTCFEGHR